MQTYGEQCVQYKMGVICENGRFVSTQPKPEAQRMPTEKIGAYYNAKLAQIWDKEAEKHPNPVARAKMRLENLIKEMTWRMEAIQENTNLILASACLDEAKYYAGEVGKELKKMQKDLLGVG